MQNSSFNKYRVAFGELFPIIQKEIPISVRVTHKLSLRRIVEDTMSTQENFAPDKTLTEILQQEVPYYVKHGMNAFDSGYTQQTKKPK